MPRRFALAAADFAACLPVSYIGYAIEDVAEPVTHVVLNTSYVAATDNGGTSSTKM